MSEEFGNDFITITDDEGNEFELELLDTIDYNGQTFSAFLPADMDEDDPDYGLILLRITEDENGEEIFESIDDEDELEEVHQMFITIFDAEEGEDGEE
jgi:uncharacterized protein YrzB (UPF0473 family)